MKQPDTNTTESRGENRDGWGTWDYCTHKWKVRAGDSMMAEMSVYEREEVVCTICGCPGEWDVEANDVYWPAT